MPESQLPDAGDCSRDAGCRGAAPASQPVPAHSRVHMPPDARRSASWGCLVLERGCARSPICRWRDRTRASNRRNLSTRPTMARRSSARVVRQGSAAFVLGVTSSPKPPYPSVGAGMSAGISILPPPQMAVAVRSGPSLGLFEYRSMPEVSMHERNPVVGPSSPGPTPDGPTPNEPEDLVIRQALRMCKEYQVFDADQTTSAKHMKGFTSDQLASGCLGRVDRRACHLRHRAPLQSPQRFRKVDNCCALRWRSRRPVAVSSSPVPSQRSHWSISSIGTQQVPSQTEQGSFSPSMCSLPAPPQVEQLSLTVTGTKADPPQQRQTCSRTRSMNRPSSDPGSLSLVGVLILLTGSSESTCNSSPASISDDGGNAKTCRLTGIPPWNGRELLSGRLARSASTLFSSLRSSPRQLRAHPLRAVMRDRLQRAVDRISPRVLPRGTVSPSHSERRDAPRFD